MTTTCDDRSSEKYLRRAQDAAGDTCVEILQRDLLALIECAEALKDFQPMRCATVGIEDMEPGCCRSCRARDSLAKLEAL